jgi:hypothetical protein
MIDFELTSGISFIIQHLKFKIIEDGSTCTLTYGKKKMDPLSLGVFNVVSRCFLRVFGRKSTGTYGGT